MRIITLCFALFLFSFSIIAQNRFNLVTPLAGENLPEILVDGSDYISVSQKTGFKQLLIFKHDSAGHITQSKVYEFDSLSFIEGCGDCLNQINDRYYFAQTDFYNAFPLFYGITRLVELNSNLDTIKTFEYYFQDSVPVQAFSMRTNSDSTFLVAGLAFRHKQNVYKYDLLVAQFDTSFNLMWETAVPDQRPQVNAGYIPSKILVHSGGDIFVSGYATYTPNISFLARLNGNNGSLKWIKEYNEGPDGNDFLTLYQISDTTFMFAMDYTWDQSDFSGSFRKRNLKIGIMDTSGTILQAKNFMNKKDVSFHTNLFLTQDGNFYVAGRYADSARYYTGGDKAFGLKFTPTLDSLWTRFYWYGDSLDYSKNENFKPTPDGGFIHIGYYQDVFMPDTNVNQMWLFKTDQYGCLEENCHIDIPEYKLQATIDVYPNPSSGIFNILLKSNLENGLTVKVFDATGREVIAKSYTKQDVESVDLSTFPPGQYTLEVWTQQGFLGRQKLIKN